MFLYHFVPRMQGTTLYPLNQLKDIHPDVYEREVKKYEGREKLLGRHVPTLNCLWNDVLFLMAVHPSEIKRVIESVGLPAYRRLRMFQFDLGAFDQKRLAAWTHRKGRHPQHSPFDPSKYDEYRDFEKDSAEYYKEAIAQGKRPMLPAHIPHILYKGALDISGVTIVEAA